jgi:uncharacterized membrane protein
MPLQTPAVQNIEAVARMEQEFLQRRSLSQRVGDAIASLAGSMWFIWLHLAFFGFWIPANLGVIPNVEPFDPWPFVLLTLIVSAEAVLLSTFVLMKQNRMQMRADQRDHLNLQIDLLAEKEITKMLQMLRLICERLQIQEPGRDTEVKELSQETAVDRLVDELQRTLPKE